MKLKNLFVFHSVVALFNGAGMVLMPVQFLSTYGITFSDPAAIVITKLLGAGLLTYCFVAWLARNAGPSDARRAILLGFSITLTIGFIVALMGQLAGVFNALGWMTIGLYLLLALGYGYYYMKPDTA